MPKVKHGVIAVIGMLVLMALTACGDSDSIEGKWKIADIDKDSDQCVSFYDFHDDGTYKVKYYNDLKEKNQTDKGKYKKIDGDKHLYKMKATGEGIAKIKRSDDSLTVTDQDTSQSCTFDKQ